MNSRDDTQPASEAFGGPVTEPPELPVDPMTGRPGRPDRAPEPPAGPVERSTAPPWWLVAFTLLIPVSVGLIWYFNWMGRKLTPGTIIEYLSSKNDRDVAHALIQVAIQAQEAAEAREGNRVQLQRGYDLRLASLNSRAPGAETEAARKELSDSYRQALKLNEEEYQRTYADLEQTFDAVLNFSQNAEGRAVALIEACCGALAVMERSTTFRDRAARELRRYLSHESKVVRRAAACNLAAWDDRSGRDIVLEMLDDPDPAARVNACLALAGGVGLRTDDQRAKKLADSDPDPTVRDWAYRAYTSLKGQVD